jgi:hypothetical protein
MLPSVAETRPESSASVSGALSNIPSWARASAAAAPRISAADVGPLLALFRPAPLAVAA